MKVILNGYLINFLKLLIGSCNYFSYKTQIFRFINYMFIDSHIHLDKFVDDGILDKIIKNAEQNNVQKMISIGGSDDANLLSISTHLQLCPNSHPNKDD